MTEKVKLLFLAANPAEAYRLRLGQEFRLIDREIRSSPTGHLFEVLSAWSVRPEDLLELLLIHRPAIVHFSGHATNAKGIILENDAGKMNPVSPEALAGLLRPLRASVRMIFLNMCYTQHYVDELAQFIDCVVGIKNKINDKSAITFSTSFYKALAWGFPVQVAFQMAKNQILLRRLRYRGSPIIKIRDGIEYPTAGSQHSADPSAENGISKHPLIQSIRTDPYASDGTFKSLHLEIVEIRREVSALRNDLQQLMNLYRERAEEPNK